jgi:hypothetical protein
LWLYHKSKHTYYSNYWKAVCINKVEVYQKLGTERNQGDASIVFGLRIETNDHLTGFSQDVLDHTHNAGISEPASTFLFPWQSQMSNTNGQLTASLHFLVKPQAPDPIFPVSVRFYWAPSVGKWLPVNFIVGSLLLTSGIEMMF